MNPRLIAPSSSPLLLLLCLFILVHGTSFSCFSYAAERLNVLMIVSDDLNDCVGYANGHPQVQTPHLDRLADRGVAFLNAHCQAPICNPSRTSILTGLRPTTTGVYALEPWFRTDRKWRDHLTLPQYFAEQGYYTVSTGKIYHDWTQFDKVKTERPEFDELGFHGGFGPLPPEKFVETPDKMRLIDWGPYPERDEEGDDYKVADWAIEKLRNMPKDKPFFLSVGFARPHLPLYAPPKWFELYPEETLCLPPYLENDRDDVPNAAWYLHWKLPEVGMKWVQEHNQWKPIVRAYLASVSYMDDQVGRVLDALEKEGLAEKTVIVFWGDQGWHLGQKELFSKTTLWDPSTKSPLIFAGPGISPQGRCNQAVELLDIYPSLIELCGLPENSLLEGHSLCPQLQDVKTPRTFPAITSDGPGNHSVRTEQFRYTKYADGSEEFYDMQVDPNEWTNLVAKPEFQDDINRLENWIPENPSPPLPGSRSRLVEKKGNIWYWEGIPIEPQTPVPALGIVPENHAPHR
ncbi:MAG: sulfatase [Thermoguttaceae bacterium]